MSGTNINLPGVSLSASALTVATMQVSGLSTGVVHSDGTGNLSSSLVVDADVNVAAAIAGTKISPNFGSQNILTTGTLGAGATTLTSTVTFKSGATTLGTSAISSSNWLWTLDPGLTTSGFQIFATGASQFIHLNGGSIYMDSAAIFMRDTGGAACVDLTLNSVGATTAAIASTVTGFTLSQATHATVAHPMTIQAGNTTTGTGSSLTLTSGTGSVASGALQLQAGGTTRIQVDNTGLGFYGHATTAQQLLATGAAHTVDDVITALQTLGLVKQA